MQNESIKQIVSIFQSKEEVSLVEDILPIIEQEFMYEPLCQRTLCIVEEFISKCLMMLSIHGKHYIGVPRFGIRGHEMLVIDYVYKRV